MVGGGGLLRNILASRNYVRHGMWIGKSIQEHAGAKLTLVFTVFGCCIILFFCNFNVTVYVFFVVLVFLATACEANRGLYHRFAVIYLFVCLFV